MCYMPGSGGPFLKQMKGVVVVPPETDMKSPMEWSPLLLEDCAEEEVRFSADSHSQGSNIA